MMISVDMSCDSSDKEKVNVWTAVQRELLQLDSSDTTTRRISEVPGKEYTPKDTLFMHNVDHRIFSLHIKSHQTDFINLFLDEKFWLLCLLLLMQ